MIAAPLTWMRRRWDVTPDPAQAIPFAELRTRINLKRIELVGLAMFANEIGEAFSAIGLHLGSYLYLTFVNAAVDLAVIAAARWVLARGGPRLRVWLPPLVVILLLLLFQNSIAVVAATGRLSSSYPLGVLGVALLFVLPPRILACIMAGTLASFVAIVWHTGVPMAERIVTIRIAILAALVASVAGALIHAARERDHEQKRTIHDQNQRLLRSNAEREEVMAFAAHDLRSPLLGLRNLVAFALPRASADPALALQTLEEAGRSLDGTLALIGDLLAAHEAEYGPLHGCDGDLRLALRGAAERNRPLSQTAGIPLRLALPDAAVPAHVDPAALARILDNLVTNAVRFSPAGGVVTLSCRHEAGASMLCVEDEGPGIPEAEWPHLFGKFRRGPAMPSRGPVGTGLGLFIVGTLTARIGARIAYRPVQPQGSGFEIAFPGASQAAPGKVAERTV